MSSEQDELREQISKLIWQLVDPGMYEVEGIPESEYERITSEVMLLVAHHTKEAELKVWRYIAMTPIVSTTIVYLDADPSGQTSYRDLNYTPPKKFVDEKIAELSAPQQSKGRSA